MFESTKIRPAGLRVLHDASDLLFGSLQKHGTHLSTSGLRVQKRKKDTAAHHPLPVADEYGRWGQSKISAPVNTFVHGAVQKMKAVRDATPCQV